MGRVILQNANLIDGERAARPDSTVVVEGERVTQVGNPDSIESSDRVIDLGGRSLMPGMVLCHFHAAYDTVGASSSPVGMDRSGTYLALRAAANVKLLLMSGFTSVVGGSTAYDIDASLKAAIDDGIIMGPRFIASSRDLVTTGDSQDMAPWFWQMGGEGAVRICDGADEFRRAVREEIKRGADIVKLYPSGGHGVPLAKDQMSITREELKAAVDAAHDRRKKVRGHIVSKRAIMESVGAGVDVIDHADMMDAECIEAFLKAGSFVVPSLFYPLSIIEDAEINGQANRHGIGNMKEDFERVCSILPEAHAAGVKFTLGDDYGTRTLPHGEYPKELELYVRHAGLSPLEIIGWATKNGAELMGMGADLGTIQVGKLADLLIVDGDPTVDITVLQHADKLHAIMKGGIFVKDELRTVGSQ